MGLDTVETVLWAENEFGIEIPDVEASEIQTVGDFSAYIRQRLLIRDGFTALSESKIFERTKAHLVSHHRVRPELISREAIFVKDLGLE